MVMQFDDNEMFILTHYKLSNKEISDQIGKTPCHTNKIRQNAMFKLLLHVRTNQQLIKLCIVDDKGNILI